MTKRDVPSPRNGAMARLRFCAVCILLLSAGERSSSTQFFVSPTGDDTNPGTIDLPFKTIQKAVGLSSTVFQPGDTIYVRGGVYESATTTSISKSGSSSAGYHLLAYPGERAMLDCSSMPRTSSARGISLSGSYWHLYGLDVKAAGDNGMNISGSNNIIEFCAFFENGDTGLQLGGGASNNRIVNCDSYFNVDPGQGNADGFSPKLDVGTGNSFYGCRAWQNSDDGWDGYLRPANNVSTTLENCWCFMNGYLKSGAASTGNGNGFKMGGSDNRDLMHNFVLTQCLAFDNREKGFDQNNNRGSMTLYNCTAYRNGRNYVIADTLAFSRGKVLTVKNSLSLGDYGSLHGAAVQQTNSWLAPFPPVTAADFLSVDTAGARGPRKADGSLPDLPFMHLAPGSPFIDAGTDVGIPFNGRAPDLGAFESPAIPSAVSNDGGAMPEFRLLLNFPNPFNPSTHIVYVIPTRGNVAIRIYDLRGSLVREMPGQEQDAGSHAVEWNGEDAHARAVAAGVYFARVTFNGQARTGKLVLVR
jgi:hypothetical protein